MKKLGLFFLMAASSCAFALQKHPVQPGVATNVVISASKLNEISLQGERIGSIKSKSNKFKMIKDDKQGKLYLQPLSKTSFEIFVISEAGKSYPLKIIPAKMGGETIVLVPEGQRKGSAWEKNATYKSVIAKLLIGLYNQTPVPGFEVAVGKKCIPSIKGGKAYQRLVYLGEHMVGMVFELSNTTKSPLFLEETQFFVPGVLAVSVEHAELAPKARTRVFLIKAVV